MPPTVTRGPIPQHMQPLTHLDPPRVDRLRLLGRLGSDDTATTYAAVTRDGVCVCATVIHAEYAADPDYRARFAAEARLLPRVRGHCTVPVLQVDTEAPRPWLVCAYAPGRTLREHVDGRGHLTGGLLVGLAAGTAEALAAIHAAGIVHRDLTPDTVVLGEDRPWVGGFGIARGEHPEPGGARSAAPAWIAPELADGGAPTPASDVFAWGAVVAHAATGRTPFGPPGDSLHERWSERAPDLDDVPTELQALLRLALHRDPAQRPAAAEALAAVYGRWHGLPWEQPLTAVGATAELLRHEWTQIPPFPRARPRPRRRRLIGAATAAAVVCGGAAGYAVHDHAPLAATVASAASQDASPSPSPSADADAEPTAGNEASVDPPVAANGVHVTAIDGRDTYIAAEGGNVVWVIRLVAAERAAEGVRFTAVANYQHLATRALDGQSFGVSAHGAEYPATPGPLTEPLDAASGSNTVEITVPGAPEQGVLWFQDVDYAPDQAGFPPLGLCYQVGEAGDSSFAPHDPDVSGCE